MFHKELPNISRTYIQHEKLILLTVCLLTKDFFNILITSVGAVRTSNPICFQIAGVQIWPLPNKPNGTFDLDEMEEKVRDHRDDHEPMTSLICVENTQNWCGGKVLPLDWLDDVSIAVNDPHEVSHHLQQVA
jgi:hypothetical protein